MNHTCDKIMRGSSQKSVERGWPVRPFKAPVGLSVEVSKDFLARDA